MSKTANGMEKIYEGLMQFGKSKIYEMLKQKGEYIDRAEMYALFILRELVIISIHIIVQAVAAGVQKRWEDSLLSICTLQ